MFDPQALTSASNLLLRGIRDYAIFTLNPDGTILAWNEGAERITGFGASEMIGQPCAKLQVPENVAINKSRTLLETARQHGRCEDEGWRPRKDGSRFWAFSVLSAIRDLQGQIVGFTEILSDMTARRRLLASERKARADAEHASQAKDDFLAALSHELRTPLTPALLTIALLERDKEIPERCRADIEVLRRNIEMEARLIDDLLDLTRVMNQKMTMHFETVDVHQILWNADRTCRAEDGIEVTFDLAASEHHVRADLARLQQVFWNLLNNAHKFTPIGGRIVVHSWNPAPDKIAIDVTDTGRGIEPELLPKIFNAFEQGDPQTARGFGGLGLGLTISKAIIDAHRGIIESHSAGKGKGSTFSVSLTTIPAGVQASACMSLPSTTESPNTDKPLRILLVEDHEPTLRVISRLLSDLGHEVHSVTTVCDAFQTLDSHPFDLLISDLGLPDGSGYDVMEYAAQRHQLKGIALSGYGMSEDIERSKDAGFRNHLIKPVDIQTLMNAVSEACAV